MKPGGGMTPLCRAIFGEPAVNNCTKKISDVPPRNAIELHNSTPGPLILVPSTNELEIVGRRWRDADCRLVAAIPERVKGRHVIILAKDTDEDRARAEAALTEALISGAEHGRVVSLPGWGGRYPKFSAWCDHYSLEAAVHGNQGRILPKRRTHLRWNQPVQRVLQTTRPPVATQSHAADARAMIKHVVSRRKTQMPPRRPTAIPCAW